MTPKDKLPSFNILKLVTSVLTIFLIVAIYYYIYKHASVMMEPLANTKNIMGGKDQFVRMKEPVFDGII